MTQRAQLARLPFGLLDSALASLGMLAIGLYAVRVFDVGTLGVFALFRSTFILAAVVPRQLLLLPAELSTLDVEKDLRLAVLGKSLRWGAVPAVLAALSLPAVVLLATAVPMETRWAFALSALAAAILSPLQDHLRRLAHLSGSSWLAAQSSLVLVVGTVASLFALHRSGVGAAVVPFAALSFGNFLSLLVGLITAQRVAPPTSPPVNPRQLMKRGRWLLAVGAVSPATTFLSVAIVSSLAGATVMGFAEAARTVAQPVFIFGQGLAAVSNPQSLESARRRDRRAAALNARNFLLLLTGAAVLYLAIVAVPWPGNPMMRFFPSAYVIGGLVALQVLANVANGAGVPFRAEVMGAGRDRRLTGAELAGNSVQVAVAFTAGVTGSFSRPLGDLLSGLALVPAYRIANRGHFPPPKGEVSRSDGGGVF